MAAVFPSGENAKVLKDNFEMANGVKKMTGALDPSAVAVDAPKGSTYQSTSTGKIYVKQDAGSTTNWLAPTTVDGPEITWNADAYTIDVPTGLGPVNQVGQEIYTIIHNATGADIPNGTAVRITGVLGDRPTVSLAHNRTEQGVTGKILITTMDIPDGTEGIATGLGRVNGIDTTGYTGGALYISDVDGELTSTRPVFPKYALPVAGLIAVDAVDGIIDVQIGGSVEDTFHAAFDGSFRESINFTVASDGTTITGTLENKTPADDLTMIFSDGLNMFDTTTVPATVALIAGTTAIPQNNYIYIPMSTKVLTVSTSGFPSDEHIKVADVLVQSAADVVANDALSNRNWNDHLKAENDNGHILHIAERMRQNHAEWNSGAELIPTVVGGIIDISVGSGTVYQLHKQNFPAFDTATGSSVYVPNHFTSPYLKTSDIETLIADANGDALNNTSYSLVVWGVQNKTGTASQLMVNLPSGTYSKNTPELAESDSLNYSIYTIPRAFKGKGFLIARMTFVNNGGTATLVSTEDLRGKVPNAAAGGAAGGGGVITFSGLTDTPSAYTGNGDNLVRVNDLETGLEYYDPATEAFRADTLIGNQTDPDNVVVQDGLNYNATDSTLVGGTTVDNTPTSFELSPAVVTPSGTTAGSLIAFDAMVDPHYIKEHWYKVTVKYGISGTTDDLYSLAVYDNDILIEGQTIVKLPATNNQTKLATILFKSPASPTKIQVKFEQLVTTAETLAITKLWYNAGDLTTLTLAQDYSNSYWFSMSGTISTIGTYTRQQLIDSYGLKEGCSGGSDCAFIDSIERISEGNVIVNYASAGLTQPPAIDAQIISDGVGNIRQDDITSITNTSFQYTTTTATGSSGVNVPFAVTFGIQGEDLKTASSTGIAASGEIDLSNYQYPQYDISSLVSGLDVASAIIVGTPYQSSTGEWWLKFAGTVTLSTGSRSTMQFQISGVDISKDQGFTASQSSSGTLYASIALADSASDTFKLFHAPGTTTGYSVYGDVQIAGKPTWATKKNSFSGTVVAPVAVLVDTEWESYTPTTQGFGTVSGVDFKWRRVGDSVEIQGNLTTGTPTATEAQIGLPSGQTVSTKMSTRKVVGYAAQGGLTSQQQYPMATSGDSYLNIGLLSSGLTGLLVRNGSDILGAGIELSLHATIPIEGWKVSETGTVATTTDVIYKYAHRYSTNEKKCGYDEISGKDVYCRTIYFPTQVTAANATYLNVGTDITLIDSVAHQGTAWTIKREVGTGTSGAEMHIYHDKASGYIGLFLNTYVISAGTKILFKYTRD